LDYYEAMETYSRIGTSKQLEKTDAHNIIITAEKGSDCRMAKIKKTR
jgi:hypothetical protein